MWDGKFRSGNFVSALSDAKGRSSGTDSVFDASASANGWGLWLACFDPEGEALVWCKAALAVGVIVRCEEALGAPILKHSLAGTLGQTGSEF